MFSTDASQQSRTCWSKRVYWWLEAKINCDWFLIEQGEENERDMSSSPQIKDKWQSISSWYALPCNQPRTTLLANERICNFRPWPPVCSLASVLTTRQVPSLSAVNSRPTSISSQFYWDGEACGVGCKGRTMERAVPARFRLVILNNFECYCIRWGVWKLLKERFILIIQSRLVPQHCMDNSSLTIIIA